MKVTAVTLDLSWVRIQGRGRDRGRPPASGDARTGDHEQHRQDCPPILCARHPPSTACVPAHLNGQSQGLAALAQPCGELVAVGRAGARET